MLVKFVSMLNKNCTYLKDKDLDLSKQNVHDGSLLHHLDSNPQYIELEWNKDFWRYYRTT